MSDIAQAIENGRLDRFGIKRQAEMWAKEEARMDAKTPILTPEAKQASWEMAKASERVMTSHRKRAKEVLEDLMTLLMGMADKHQPWPEQRGRNPLEDRELFDRYVVLAMKCAASLAPYQSPRAVIIKDDRTRPTDEYDLTKLSEEQLMALRQILIAAKPVTIDVSARDPS